MLDLLQYPKTVTICLIAFHLIIRTVRDKRRRSNLPFPPGPKGYPLLGNFFDLPTENAAQAYSELLNRHGDMVYLESLGTKILVLGSVQRTTDLLEKRSSIYSDRPVSPMLWQMGFEAYMSLMPYGSRWRRQRKMFHELFNPTVVHRYHPLAVEERNNCLRNLAERPEAFRDWARLYFARIILRGAYGIDPKGDDDPFLTQARFAIDGFNVGGKTGTYLVDFLPFLKHVPDWMPGTGWKKIARHYLEGSIESRVAPFEHVRDLHRKGVAPPSATLSLIEKLPDEDDPDFEEARLCAQDTAAIAFVGGADTMSLSRNSGAMLSSYFHTYQTVGVVLTAFLLLAMHADVQKRAQDEIDRVVGTARLPELEEREELLYVSAVLKEVSRMYQVLPLAVAHGLLEDDVYDGYFIPKGTIVIGNSWHILHDPNTYDDPFTFKPERFIKDGKWNKDVLDPHAAAFGYGRRVCPGKQLSHDTLFILVSSVLASFDISPPKDDQGNIIPLKWEFEEGLLIHPKPYKCVFTPRPGGYKLPV